MNAMSPPTPPDDAALVAASLAGNREAFGHIVARYQSLVCSVAYSATGNLGQSEDVAQETFLSAWKNLGQLREPAKLRAWLCTIARNCVNRTLGREGREPAHAAESLDAAEEAPAAGPLPSERAITREEEAILWRSLAQLPAAYREPLILFYREHQSVANVAASLDLSEDAVKQRLARGRKLLHERIAAFVAGALERTAPDRAFTAGVLALLPPLTVATSATTAGAAAAKGAASLKAASLTGLTGVVLGPIVGILSGWLGYKANLDNAASPRERRFLRRVFALVWLAADVLAVAAFVLHRQALSLARTHPALLVGMAVACTAATVGLLLWAMRTLQAIRREEAARLPPGTAPAEPPWTSLPFEYRSRWTLLGLPLVHVRVNCARDGRMLPAVAWVALGNVAYGGLFAFGGLALGTIGVGGVAVGLVAVGGCGLGALACAGLAVGYAAAGGVAVGYLASGGTALAWQAADGGVAVAHEFAVGGLVAAARHANDAAALALVEGSRLFGWARLLAHDLLFLIWLPLFWIVWQMAGLRRVARRQP